MIRYAAIASGRDSNRKRDELPSFRIQMSRLHASLMKHSIAIERSRRMLPQSFHAIADLGDERLPVFEHGIA
jgi:hypothetical protein